MKARSKELLDRAIAATVAAIEIYNKPDFLYREEAFAVLAINGWELLLKAKWLAEQNNQLRCLYILEPRTKRDGSRSKKIRTKSVTVRGTVEGNIFVTERCELQANCTLRGDIEAPRLVVNENVTFVGSAKVGTGKSLPA